MNTLSSPTPPTTYDVDYFIAKFEAIPEEKWSIGSGNKYTKCAMMHCGVKISANSNYIYNDEISALITLFRTIDGGSVISINDGWDDSYTQPTPKQRILAALHDIKAKLSAPTTT